MCMCVCFFRGHGLGFYSDIDTSDVWGHGLGFYSDIELLHQMFSILQKSII